MSATIPSDLTPARPLNVVTRSAQFWFLATVVGQIGFFLFIILFYGTRTISGDFVGWDDKANILGYEAGDPTGNFAFISHVLIGGLITLSGLAQLVPSVRKKHPTVHRANGRLFLALSLVGAISGLWLTWGRGTYLSIHQAMGVSLNGVLILVFVYFAWRSAVQRRFTDHEAWALRTFMVVSGVWFFRLAIMAWYLIGRGLFGAPSGCQIIIDPILEFGSYLLPLAILELWLFARARPRAAWLQWSAAIVITMATLLMCVGIFGAIGFMWLPVL